MNTRIKAGIGVLAVIGAAATARFLTTNSVAQNPPPPGQQGGLGGGGAPGGPGGPGGQGGGRRGPSNTTAKVTLDEAMKTATGKVSGFVNSAQLRMGPD